MHPRVGVPPLALKQLLVKRIDAYAARLSSENPGLEINRALAVKALLTQALDAIDAAPKHRGK